MSSRTKTKTPKVKLDACRILQTVNNWRTQLWPLWMRERAIVGFYNAGEIPMDEPCDDAPVSLGLGNRYIKKPFDSLMDTILMEPGYIKTEDCYPLNPARKGKVEGALDEEINAIVHHRMESAIRKVAGGSMITGRAFMFRLSRWDWLFRRGRLLHSLYETDDVYDAAFREWAFTGQLSLRDIDAHLEKTREYDGAGWNYKALSELKLYILKSTSSEKENNPMSDGQMLAMPFEECGYNKPLEVYWYLRKNGEYTVMGEEKVDLYCVSRYGQSATVNSENDGHITYKALEVQGDDENERILYYLPNAFESVDECLIPFLLDSRIDGEQSLASIDGTGKTMVPRLQMMEQLALSLCEGIAFGVQPNWTTNGQQLSETEAAKLAKVGVNPHDVVPAGLVPMQKANSLQGLSSGLQTLQMLGMSAEGDAATGEMSPFGQSQAKFKAEAEQMLQQTIANSGRRDSRFWKCLDKVAEQQTKTMCRPLSTWTTADPGYRDVKRFQVSMYLKHQIKPDEYSELRITAKVRRLAGDADRNQAVQKAVTMANYFGGQYSPDMLRFLAKDATRAVYGESIADMAIQEAPSQAEQDQSNAADQQTMMALAGIPVERRPQDDPNVHLQRHAGVFSKKIQQAQQQGSMTPAEKEGMATLLHHMAQDVTGIPKQQQQQIGQMMMQAAAQLKQIPVSGAQTEMALKEKDQARKDAQLQFAKEREGNLQGDREKKLNLQQQNLMLNMQRLVHDQNMTGDQKQIAIAKLMLDHQNSAVDRAGGIMDMVQQHHEMTQPQEGDQSSGRPTALPLAPQPQPQPFPV